MTATDELLRLLDSFEHECFMIRVEASETRAKDEDVRKAYLRQRNETAQAIEATLGREECELQETCDDYVHIGWGRCSACGGGLPAYPVNFCPNCGRKVRR